MSGCAALIDNSEQLGVQCDLGVEDLGNRAVLLGVAGHSVAVVLAPGQSLTLSTPHEAGIPPDAVETSSGGPTRCSSTRRPRPGPAWC